jgi:hypothetical protein
VVGEEPRFRPDDLRSFLLRNKIATLDELKHALGASTSFRKFFMIFWCPVAHALASALACSSELQFDGAPELRDAAKLWAEAHSGTLKRALQRF